MMSVLTTWAQRLLVLALLLGCVGVLMGADRRVGRVPAATGELTLLSGASGTFDVVAANAHLSDFEIKPLGDGLLGTVSVVDGVIHYSAHSDGNELDRFGYQLVTSSGQRLLGELRVRVVDAQAAVQMRVTLLAQSRAGVPVELREGDTVVAVGVTGGNGTVELTLPAGWPGEAMLTLHAQGVGTRGDTLVWVSGLGSARQLRVAAAGKRLVPVEWPALRLGAVSTAFHARLLHIDSESAVEEAAAMRAAAGVHPDRVVAEAALLDVVEAGVRQLPPGFADSWALLMDENETSRLVGTHWTAPVNAAIEARRADLSKYAALPARPHYHAWFWPPHAHGFVLGEGDGVLLREGGEGEYFARLGLEDNGLQWRPEHGGVRMQLNETLYSDDGGVGRSCKLANGSTHHYLVLRSSRRNTVDLLRVHGFGGIDFLARRWHRVVSEELHSPVPPDCEAEVLPDFTIYPIDYLLAQPNVDTIANAGPALSVPPTLLLGLDESGGRLVTGLLDVAGQTLALEGFASHIDVRLARAGRIEFDAFSEDGSGSVSFELQQLREGLGGSTAWSVVRRTPGVASRGWMTTGIQPQAIRGDFDWNGFWFSHHSWSKSRTHVLWASDEWALQQRWGFDSGAERATRYGWVSWRGDWVLLDGQEHHFLIEDGAAIKRRYRGDFGSTLVECPPAPKPCWRHIEHRLLPVAEVPDALGPGYDLVFVMHERGLSESEDGWALYQRFVDAWVRDPAGDLHRSRAPRLQPVRDARLQER